MDTLLLFVAILGVSAVAGWLIGYSQGLMKQLKEFDEELGRLHQQLDNAEKRTYDEGDEWKRTL